MTYEELKELYESRTSEDYFTDFIRGYNGKDEDCGFQYITHSGGGEGGAEDCESVIKVDGEFYKITYNYYSHNGFDFDYADVRKVVPKEKTVTVYE